MTFVLQSKSRIRNKLFHISENIFAWLRALLKKVILPIGKNNFSKNTTFFKQTFNHYFVGLLNIRLHPPTIKIRAIECHPPRHSKPSLLENSQNTRNFFCNQLFFARSRNKLITLNLITNLKILRKTPLSQQLDWLAIQGT